MLILSRRIGETIMVGDEIIVRVLGVKGSQVRIGVTAPQGIGVHREEVYERIKGRHPVGNLKNDTRVVITAVLASPAASV